MLEKLTKNLQLLMGKILETTDEKVRDKYEEMIRGVPLDGSRGALSLIKDTPRVALESQPVS